MAERPLRVALVSHTARMGGAELALLEIAERLDRRSVAPLVVLGEDGPLNDRLRASSIETVIEPLDRNVRERRKEALGAAGLLHPLVGARAAGAVLRLARRLREREIEIVYTNTLKAHLVGGLAGRLAGVPVVWHVRDHISSPYLPRAAVPLVRLCARALPRTVVAVSASVARTVGRGGVIVLHQGIPLPSGVADRIPDGRLRVGLVGRISPWKGQDVFLQAAARLAAQFPECEFVLAGAPLFGEEEYERELHAQTIRLGIKERVRFLGHRENVWQVYAELDIVVHASTLAEPYGRVVLEAMASHRPLIAAAGGGVLELVEHERTGLLVVPGDPEALADALARLLCFPDERRRLAAAGRRHVEENFSVERDAAELQRVWRELAKRRDGSRGKPGGGLLSLVWRAVRIARRIREEQRRWVQVRRWRPLVPPGRRATDLSESIIGLDPARTEDLACLIGMTPSEVVEKLCFAGPEALIEVYGVPIRVRPGTADIFTVDDTFGAGYHRSPWELPERSVIVDLGANIGLTVLDYGLTYPKATILGIELDEHNVRLARANTAGVPGASIIHGGVATSEGFVTYGAADTNAYAISQAGDRVAPAVTIAGLLEQLGSCAIDLLKVDIEGAEQEVLADGDGWAPRVRHILVETHLPYTREECVRDLRRLGFDAHFDQRHPAGVAASKTAPS